jgi:hypothetical protein
MDNHRRLWIVTNLLLVGITALPVSATAAEASPSQAASLDRFFGSMLGNRREDSEGGPGKPEADLSTRNGPVIRMMLDAFIAGESYTFHADNAVDGPAFRSNAAFDGMGKVAASTGVRPEISAAAREALGTVIDPRACKPLIAIVESNASTAEFKSDALRQLDRQMTSGGSVAAADFLGALAASKASGPTVEQARRIVARVGEPSYPVASLQALTKSTSSLVREPAERALKLIKALDPRVRPADAQVLADLQAARVKDVEQLVQAAEYDIVEIRKSAQKNVGKEGANGDVQGRIVAHRKRILTFKAEAARVTRTKPLEFGAELLAEYVLLTRSESSLVGLIRQADAGVLNGAADVEEIASRVTLIRYNVLRQAADAGTRVDTAFETRDEPPLRRDGFSQTEHPLLGTLSAQESFERALRIREGLERLGTPGILTVKKLYLQGLAASARKKAGPFKLRPGVTKKP